MTSIAYNELKELIYSAFIDVVCFRCRQRSTITKDACRKYDCHLLYDKEAHVIIEKLVDRGIVEVEIGGQQHENSMDVQRVSNDGHGSSVPDRVVDGNAHHSEVEYCPLSESRLSQCLNCIHIIQNMSITKTYTWFCKRHRMPVASCGVCDDFDGGKRSIL